MSVSVALPRGGELVFSNYTFGYMLEYVANHYQMDFFALIALLGSGNINFTDKTVMANYSLRVGNFSNKQVIASDYWLQIKEYEVRVGRTICTYQDICPVRTDPVTCGVFQVVWPSRKEE